MCAEKIVTCADLWNVHLQNCAQCRKLHLQKSVRCRFAHFVHDGFSHICRFAHLHICTFAESCEHARKVFCTCVSLSKCFWECAQTWIFFFLQICKFCHFLTKIEKNAKKSKFPKMSENVPKKAHVFLSGTRVVPGPTRLTTQGGKSRQNMH